MNPVEISIVVPVYNSAQILPELSRQVEDALQDITYELILVYDRSPDNSWQAITEICASNRNAVGICLRKNAGQDNAIMAGFQLSKGDFVVVMDDDLQHSPYDIKTLLAECRKGHDVCYALFPQKKQKAWKNFGSWLNGKLSEKLLSKPREIYLSPFKVIKGEVIKEVIRYSGPYPYIDALLLTVTHNVTQVGIEHHERFAGKSNFNLIRSATVFFKHATGYSIYPLRLATYTGIVAALLAFLFGLYYFIEYLVIGSVVEGWISIVLIILFFVGIMLLSMGIIGEYVGRIFMTMNNKPQYTIEKVTRGSHSG
jgi:polyisoprenyl-phosphate glycosyltransferase